LGFNSIIDLYPIIPAKKGSMVYSRIQRLRAMVSDLRKVDAVTVSEGRAIKKRLTKMLG